MKKIWNYLFGFEYPWLFTVCALVGIVISCCTGEAALINDSNMTVLELLQNPRYIQSVSASHAFNAGLSGWFFILLPAIASMVSITYFCDELNKGYYQYFVGREGLRRYLSRKYIKIGMYGFVIVVLGVLLYLLLVYAVFPLSETYAVGVTYYGEEISVWSELLADLSSVLAVAFWGSALAVFAYTLALFIHNKYVVVSIPVFLNYVLYDFMWQYIPGAAVLVFVAAYIICIARSGRSFL